MGTDVFRSPRHRWIGVDGGRRRKASGSGNAGYCAISRAFPSTGPASADWCLHADCFPRTRGDFRRSRQSSATTSLFPMLFGVVSAIVAVIAGFLLYHGHRGDYGDNPLVARHLWGGLAFAIAAVFTLMVKAWTASLAGNPAWYRLLLFGSVGIMGFTSHDGASITHGSDYLTLYAPPPLRKLLGIDPKRPSVAPAKRLRPRRFMTTLSHRFSSAAACNATRKAKPKENTAWIPTNCSSRAAGKAPASILETPQRATSSSASNSARRMRTTCRRKASPTSRPMNSPCSNGGSTAARIQRKCSPTSRCPQKSRHRSRNSPPQEQSARRNPRPFPTTSSSPPSQNSPRVPRRAFLSIPDSPLLTFTAVPLRGHLDDEAFGKLGPVLPHLAAVDLSATQITDKSIATLATATELRQLRLTQTAITDAAIESLLKLPSLESINFYGTKVTDAGIARLAALPNLKHLYIWQTPVSPEVLKALQEKLPECEIIGEAPAPSPPATSR